MSRSPPEPPIYGYDPERRVSSADTPAVLAHPLTRRQRRLLGADLPDLEFSPRRRSYSAIGRLVPVPEDRSIQNEPTDNDSLNENVFATSSSESLTWDNSVVLNPIRSSTWRDDISVGQVSTNYSNLNKHKVSTASNKVVIGEDSLMRLSTEDLEESFESAENNTYTAMEAEISRHKTQLNRLSMIVEDDILPVVFAEVTIEFLKTKVQLAEEWKVLAQDSMLYLMEEWPDEYDRRYKENAVKHKKELVTFIKEAQKVLRDAEQHAATQPRSITEAAAMASRDIKATRVNSLEPALVQDIEDHINELKLIQDVVPQSDGEFRKLDDRFSNVIKKIDVTRSDAKQLCRDAIDAGLGTKAENIEKNLRSLKDRQSEVQSKLQDIKIDLNIYSSGAIKGSDLKPPSFSGEATDKGDFYTFRQEFDEYAAFKNITKNELLRVLVRTCLTGIARSACLHMTSVEEVFQYLLETYGNVRVLMLNKIEEVRKLGQCTGTDIKKREWALAVKSKLVYIHGLAKKHSLEDELYFSPLVSEIQKGLPSKLHEDFKDILKSSNNGSSISRKDLFDELLRYMDIVIQSLTFEINYNIASNTPDDKPRNNLKQQPKGQKNGELKKVFNTNKAPDSRTQSVKNTGNKSPSAPAKNVDCRLCTEKHTHLFYCPIFQQTDLGDRFNLVKESQVCFRCMKCETCVDFADRRTWWDSHKDECETAWACLIGRCGKKYKSQQLHFLVCSWHTEVNKQKEKDFIKTLDTKVMKPGIKFFFNVPMLVNWRMNSSKLGKPVKGWTDIPDVMDPSIYMLQYLLFDGQKLLVFYDSGCMTASISARAAAILDTENLRPGPTDISVAGGETIRIPGGDERFTIPLADGKTRATITALNMPRVTTPFPQWELGAVLDEVEKEYKLKHPTGEKLPTFPPVIGGVEVDIMIGIRYSKYFPELVFQTSEGLGVYRSKFLSPNGQMGILGGPHKAWRTMVESTHFMESTVYTSQEKSCLPLTGLMEPSIYPEDLTVEIPEKGEEHEFSLSSDPGLKMSLESDEVIEKCTYSHCEKHLEDGSWALPLHWSVDYSKYSSFTTEKYDRFIAAENTGTLIEYRCMRCRNCNDCKKGEQLELSSLKEESEQYLIESCVRLDPNKKTLTALLPFIADPSTQLKPNRGVAEKIFNTQMKLAEKDHEMKAQIVASHEKLKSRGYVCELVQLPVEVQKLVDAEPGYFIPWRVVFSSSVSTPCRMVFDGSSRTPGGESLNNILAKGMNVLGSLLCILIGFRLHLVGLCADVSMAYNGISLDESHYRYQKYLWKDNLDPGKPTKVMIIKTLIYGIRPSGNLTMAGFQKLAEHSIKFHPENKVGAEALSKDAYMDDIVTGQDSLKKCEEAAEQLKFTLSLGSMKVKDITMSGKLPSELVSKDGRHIGVVGLLWDPEEDLLGLDIKKLYIGKPKRGKIPDPVEGDIGVALKGKFNKRTLVGKTAGIFDPLGLVTPATAKLKLHLHDLIPLKLDWDDEIPETYLERWIKNLEDIQKLKELRFRRTVVPPNAESLDVGLIVSSDASKEIAIATVHSRIKCTDGSFHVQLVCAKSKIVTDLTVPRAELKAAVVSTTLAYCVKRVFRKNLRDVIHVTDSTICLYWLSQDQRPLQTGVRNAVIEIRRLSDPVTWFHVESENNVADLGTRQENPVDMAPNSVWLCGKDWMRMEIDQMPLRTIEQITLSSEEKRTASKEMKAPDINGIVLINIQSRVADRCSFSKYLIDPNLYRWSKTLRILCYVFRFLDRVRKWKRKWFPQQELELGISSRKSLVISNWEIERSSNYFFSKATLEVKQFAKKKDWTHAELGKDGILRYTGRIVDGQEIGQEAECGLDLEPLMFVKPILDRYSPVAYAIMVNCHEEGARHRNSAATLRESRNVAYILQGRDLASEIREACPFCKRYRAKLLEVEMGSIHPSRLLIAPAFYHVQIDLFGPMSASCEHNHRSTVKIYGVVFKDPATCAISVHCMQAYNAAAFIQAYIRFSSRFGHPSKVYIDEGSQLVKAFKEMEYASMDITRDFSINYGVGIEFVTCPVGGHNAHGVVERSILEVKRLFNQIYKGLKLDVLSYETAFAFISNELNCFPICIGSRTAKLDQIDLITPARLIHGRNNKRSLSGQVQLSVPSRLIKQIDLVTEAWWEVWKTERILDLIPQPPKWRRSSGSVEVGDLVIFLKTDKEKALGGPVWRLGRVVSVEVSADNVIRVVNIEYKNQNESVFRQTRRSARKVAVVHHEGELELVDQLNEAARIQNIHYLMSK